MRTPLAPVDANFFNMDTPTTHQAIACLCILDRPPNSEQFRQAVEKLVESHPRLAQKVNRPNLLWEKDKDFLLSEHIEELEVRQGGVSSLLVEASRILSAPLDLSRPLWRFSILSSRSFEPGEKSLSAILLKIHHAVADGLGGMEMVNLLCCSSRRSSQKRAENIPRLASKPAFGNTVSRLKSLKKLFAEGTGKKFASPLNGVNSPQRCISTLELPLDLLLTVKRTAGVTLNDVVLALTGAAARKYHQMVDYPCSALRVIMPVSLRGAAGHSPWAGNCLSGVGITLPIALETPLAQLRQITQAVQQVKEDGSFGAYGLLARFNRALPRPLGRLISEQAATKTNFICSTLTGSRRPLRLAGANVLAKYGVPALMKGQGVAVSFVRYSEKVFVSLISDPSIVEAPDRFLDFIEEAVEQLAREMQITKEREHALGY